MRSASRAVFVAICSVFLTPAWPGGLRSAAAEQSGAARYQCPMHPSYVQDRQGDCPVCGMKLVPMKAAANVPDVQRAPIAGEPSAAPSAGAMRIDGEGQKMIGMVVTPARRLAGSRALRMLGRVTPDDARLFKLNAGMSGSMRDVSPVTAGSRVAKGQVLGSYYAPEALSVLQVFIVNTQGFDRLQLGRLDQDGKPSGEGHGEDAVAGMGKGKGLYKANLQQRITQLENLGVSALQREEVARAGTIPDTIKIVSPADGVVLARGVFPGLKFERGFELYRIADLRKVWVLADVFLQDARHVRVGMRAEVSVPEQELTLPATVTEILPQFDATTRTLKVKLALDNRGLVLRPDMFVDVAVKVDLPAGVVVPSDAIVDSGLVKRVFVQSGADLFEPRVVETGWRSGDQVEVVKGLRPGELVVTSGTFFLDSETRMRPPSSGAAAAGDRAALTGQRSPGGSGDSLHTRDSAGREQASRRPTGDGR